MEAPKPIPLNLVELRLIQPLLVQVATAKQRLEDILSVVRSRGGEEGIQYALDLATKSLIPLINSNDVTVTSAPNGKRNGSRKGK